MLLVSFHGGSSDDHHVAAYHDHGELVAAKVLNPDPTGLEPRALGMVGPGQLWVVDSSKDASAILSFTGAGARYERTGAAVTCADADSLRHPFDYTFSPDGNSCWVSNQDTNVVARFEVDAGSLKPAPTAPRLPKGTYLDGTFVASSVGKLPCVPETTTVPRSEGGLKVRISGGKVTHSVRGVVAVGGVLYVADEPGDAVKAYDAATGTFIGATEGIEAPVHLLAADGALYASGKHGVFRASLDAGKLSFDRVLKLDGAAGMAFGKGHHFYVADRHHQKVFAYHHFTHKSPGKAHHWNVPAPPEFIYYLHNDG